MNLKDLWAPLRCIPCIPYYYTTAENQNDSKKQSPSLLWTLLLLIFYPIRFVLTKKWNWMKRFLKSAWIYLFIALIISTLISLLILRPRWLFARERLPLEGEQFLVTDSSGQTFLRAVAIGTVPQERSP